MKRLFYIGMLLCMALPFSALGQIQVQLTVQSGAANSNCADLIPPADPVWEVNVAGQGWTIYDMAGPCFTQPPHQPYSAGYSCPEDVPAVVQVCFRAFDNDALFPCTIVRDCAETICQDFVIPTPGNSANYTLTLNAPAGSSGGAVNFSIATVGVPDNDLICGAVDLGILSYDDTLGNRFLSNYNNLCADAIGDINPQDFGVYFINEAGVWFRFNSGPAPSGLIVVDVLSDPALSGDPIDLEAAVFTAAGGCSGALAPYNDYSFVSNTLDTRVYLNCPSPNTDYYILVDGGLGIPDGIQGAFGIQVWDVGIQEGGDLRCEFEDFGAVPVGGSVGTNGFRSNFCGTPTQDPFVPAFVSQHSVWFSFLAPPSGHVLIEGISDTVKKPLGVQLAVYRAFSGTCTSFFSHVRSQYTDQDLDERLELTCLFPGNRYFILVDGSGDASRGVFSLTVSDAGDITPVTMQDTVICFGETFRVGNTLHNATGIYYDTLQVFAGCDSVVITDLTVLTEIQPVITQTQLAFGLGISNGAATISATGGAGGYTFQWCTGETGPQATQLPGGTECCVTIIDSQGCERIECFTVEYANPIVPTFENDSLRCFGDLNGELRFSASEGLPPYQYSWQNAAATLNGSGNLAAGGQAVVGNLPGGAYTVTISDAVFDTTFTILVVEPPQLVVASPAISDASCFGFCDGSANAAASGGTPPYAYAWSGSASTGPQASDLCAGVYRLTVSDANGCQATTLVTIAEPPQFTATATVVQEVACFGGNDGSATVTTNGSPQSWEWSNMASAATITGLTAGIYDVTVTNSDGCEAYAGVVIPQPSAPLSVSIRADSPISCFAAADGRLGAQVAGPYQSLSYQWSSGSVDAAAENLPEGAYQLTVTNERGCTAEATFFLNQPPALSAELSIKDINCLEGPNEGAISVSNTIGGTPPYRYALQGETFGPAPTWLSLAEGAYTVLVRDASNCELSLSAAVMGPPELIVDLGEDQTLHLGDSITLDAFVNSPNASFTWRHDPALQGPSATVRPLESGIYLVTVMDTVTFCEAEDWLRITVDRNRKVFIPNAFSPNGDNNNDVFFLHSANDVTLIRSLRIFSRTGQLVHQRENFAPNDPNYGWDGLFRGQPLSPSVFVYVAEIEFYDGKTEVFKGDIILVR